MPIHIIKVTINDDSSDEIPSTDELIADIKRTLNTPDLPSELKDLFSFLLFLTQELKQREDETTKH